MTPHALPNSWSWKQLEEIGSNGRPVIKAGPFGSSLKKECYTTSGYRIYGQEQVIAGDFSIGDYYIDEAKFRKLESCAVKPGDVLISLVGSFGKVVIVPEGVEPGIINPRLLRLSFHPGELDPDYFTHYFRSPIAQAILNRNAHGGTMGVLNAANLKELPIPMPKVSEQKRIAGILDKADAIRRKRQQAIGLTEQFLRSTFLDMFGDPVTNPKGWPMVELKSLVSRGFQNGAYYPKDYYTGNRTGVEMVHMSDAFYGFVKLDEIKRVRAPVSDVEKYSLDHNDILVARRSLNYEGSAKPCRIPKLNRDLIFESSLIRVTTERKKLHPLYFYYYLSNPRARAKYLFKHVTKSTISGINQAGLGRVEIVLPPIQEQERFVNFHEQYDASTARLAENLETLDNLFNSLVQRAFRGEL